MPREQGGQHRLLAACYQVAGKEDDTTPNAESEEAGPIQSMLAVEPTMRGWRHWKVGRSPLMIMVNTATYLDILLLVNKTNLLSLSDPLTL